MPIKTVGEQVINAGKMRVKCRSSDVCAFRYVVDRDGLVTTLQGKIRER